MEKGINTAIVELKEKLLNVIIESQLPPSIVDLILFEVKATNLKVAEQALMHEREEALKSQKEVENDGHIHEEKMD